MIRSGARQSTSYKRSRLLFVIVILTWSIFIVRLFYLQIIRHDYYSTLAVEVQERKFEIDAQRGSISILDRIDEKPLVLNENRPTVFVDPNFVDEINATAVRLATILGGRSIDYLEPLNRDSSFVVIRKKVPLETAQKIINAEIKGVGAIDQYYRSYPEGNLAAQVLGFVNSDGVGQYGVEEYLNESLKGIDGRVEAITDVHGIPLRGDDRNILSPAIAGQNITLTLDANIQKQTEDALRKAITDGRAKGGSAIVIDPNTGAIKAMANYPTFNPASFSEVEDFSVFLNNVVANPYEVGSVLKILTMATGINEGSVNRNSTYYDPGFVSVEGETIENAGVGRNNLVRTMDDVIQKSVNTGVVHVLSQLGGGSINTKARNTLYDYFSNNFGLGKLTGVEQAFEEEGILFNPQDEGDGRNIRYANMTFGQGMTNTMIQIASAVSSIVNGGTYYKPYLIFAQRENTVETIKEPVVLRQNVITKKTSNALKAMMKLAVDDGGGRSAKKAGYKIGGKTGTAQIPLGDGTYSESREIGSFAGYIEGADGVEYVIMTRVDEPQGYLFAGSGAAAPLFAEIAHWIINYDRIPPIE